MKGVFQDLTGRKFHKYTAMAYLGQRTWKCRCDCGAVRSVKSYNLINGASKSCGHSRKRHNMVKSRLYRVWRGMRARCYYEKSDSYEYYGGRGITVCAVWKDSFIPFMKWALESGYKDNLKLDRLNVNGNYEPSNCTFVTDLEQQRNRRDTVPNMIAFGEEKHPMDWSKDVRCLVSYSTLRGRVNKGWSVEKAITTPAKRIKSSIKNFE